MKNGAAITVAHCGTVMPAHAYKLKPGEGWWWMGSYVDGETGTKPSGPLGDEGIHYVRGHMYHWWPPHRKQRDALLTAATLAGPPPEPTPPTSPITAASAQAMMNQMIVTLTKDFDRIWADANKLLEDANKLAVKSSSITVTVNGHRNAR
jgi:hypothetical protein